MFRVPSTPDSRRASTNQAPSTTPAGPPPTGFTAQSFTPAGPPPTSVFGSSFTSQAPGFTNTRSAFAPTGQLNSPPIKGPLHTNPFGTLQFGNANKGFAVPSSSPPRGYEEDDKYDEDEDAERESQDDIMDFEREQDQRRPSQQASARESIETPSDMYDYIDSPRGSKRSRNGDVMRASVRSSRAGPASKESAIPAIAKSMGSNTKATLEERDELVLGTEAVLDRLDKAIQLQASDELELIFGHAVHDLTNEWNKHTKKESLPAAIGPQHKSGLAKANFLASLLLQLHHPTPTGKVPERQAPAYGRSARFGLVKSGPTNVPLPKALLNWLNANHNPYPEDLVEVQQCKPSSTAHERFWDTVYSTILRGDINTTIQLLQNANFAHADTALEDGHDEPGYEGKQLVAVKEVVGRLVELLRTCPAVTDDDWNVTDTDWALFRNRVRRALSDLEAFAEDDSEDRFEANNANVFQSSRLGDSTNGPDMRTSSRRAESKVPWSIYEQLKTVYGQLQGFREETLLCAQDWLEAVIYLTVWWDGTDDESSTMAASRRSMRSQHTREVDISPYSAYRKRMHSAFAEVTYEPEDAVLGVNTVDPIQVGLASVCEDNVEGVVGLLRGWSMPVAVAVADVASAGGWLPQSRPRSKGMMDGFDQEDLMVLSHGQGQLEGGLDRDGLLGDYADVLARSQHFKTQGGIVKEGWELAIQVLSRLDSANTAQKRIGRVLDNLSLGSAHQVDKVLAVCNNLGLFKQVRSISERYANTLAESSKSYGEAILYYARARAEVQLRSTIDLLISMSLVQSAAYPALSALDHQLDALINDQGRTLKQLAEIDKEAAQLIASHLSGYATLRRFYELRDEGDEEDGGHKSGLRPLARKREAAKAMVGLIEAAADSIHGGLYDADVKAVVKVDTLLALLGEALPLLNQPKVLLKQKQLISLLRAAEDLQTVTSRVYEQAEALFQATMSDYHGTRASSPQDLNKVLSKSTSNLAGSSYGMINSQGSIVSTDGRLTASQEDIKRGWDWRKGIALSSGKSAKGSDALRILRVQIAKDMVKSWADQSSEQKGFD